MNHFKEILESHPNPAFFEKVHASELVTRLFDCAEVCSACADACLAETHVESLKRCIRINQDCADICFTTGKILMRQFETESKLVRAQLEVCRIVCRMCELECEKHAGIHNHCRICADSCSALEVLCAQAISAFPTAAKV